MFSERRYRSGDGLTLAYRDYPGPSSATPVICLHGLTRNSRDFEALAPVLSRERRVLAPDFRGRGDSANDDDWRNYHLLTYADDIRSLLREQELNRVAIIGTSLGGLVAMLLAHADAQCIAGVVLNDIGPEIGPTGLARILSYAGRRPPVRTWEEAEAQTRDIYQQAWPGLSRKRWAELTRRVFRDEGGVPVAAMDPRVGEAARSVTPELPDPWTLFDALGGVPTLLVHGALSDILTDDIARRMRDRLPDMEYVRVSQRGHPPLLDEPEALRAIIRWTQRLD